MGTLHQGKDFVKMNYCKEYLHIIEDDPLERGVNDSEEKGNNYNNKCLRR
jgi:hypothetical protein